MGLPMEEERERKALLLLLKTLLGLPIRMFIFLEVAPDPVAHVSVFLSAPSP